MPRIKTFLYAVRMLVPNQDPQPIKVGFSSRPDKRRAAYNCGPYPCEWLGVWPGTTADELAFHHRFARLRHGMAGEWFAPDEEFLTYVTAKIAAYKKRLDQYARWAEQKAEREQGLNEFGPEYEDMLRRAAAIIENYQDKPN